MSPIIGLTDRGLALPEIGQIRKGQKVTKTRKDGSTYELPVDLEYFRVEFDEKEAETAAIFEKVYGKSPTEIRIILPFNEIGRMWDAWLEAYTAGRLVARSDGEWFTYWVDTKTGEIKVKNGLDVNTGKKVPYRDDQVVGQDYKGNKVACKPVGRLKVIVPELGRAAYLTVMTTSIHDIANISQQLEAFSKLNNGQIAGIPFLLKRRPKMISTPGSDGQRVRREKWLLSIEADPQWVRAKLSQIKRLALPDNGLAGLLEEGEEEIIEGEYEEEEWDPPREAEAVGGSGPAPQNENGNGKRPYAPDVVRQALLAAIDKYENEGWSPKDKGEEDVEVTRGIVRHNLEMCFAGEAEVEDKRHTVTRYLTGEGSTKKLSHVQLVALKRWLNARPDDGGEWQPNALSAREAAAIFEAALKDEGQLEMGL